MTARVVTRVNVAQVATWAGCGYWPTEMGSPCVWLPDQHGDLVVRVLPGEYVDQVQPGRFVRRTARPSDLPARRSP